MVQTVTFDFTFLLIFGIIIAVILLIGLIIWACLSSADAKDASNLAKYYEDKWQSAADVCSDLRSEKKDLKKKIEFLKDQIDYKDYEIAELHGRLSMLSSINKSINKGKSK